MMKKIILTFAAAIVALTVFAGNGHKSFTTTNAEKIIAITILAEARGEGEKGMYAVAAVIAQRAFERKRTPTEVCLKKWKLTISSTKTSRTVSHTMAVIACAVIWCATKTMCGAARSKRLRRLYTTTSKVCHGVEILAI